MCVLCSVSILYVCVSVGVDVPVYVCALLNVSAVICMFVSAVEPISPWLSLEHVG